MFMIQMETVSQWPPELSSENHTGNWSITEELELSPELILIDNQSSHWVERLDYAILCTEARRSHMIKVITRVTDS